MINIIQIINFNIINMINIIKHNLGENFIITKLIKL